MKKRILITGATGLIGKQICRKLTDRGDEVTVFTRSIRKAQRSLPGIHRAVKWDYHKPEEWGKYLEAKDSIIHLAGINLFEQRWTAEFKEKIEESRVVSTANISKVINTLKQKPESFITASAIGIYGNTGNLEIHEMTPHGDDFLATLTKKWEEAAYQSSKEVRIINLRTAVVLSTEEGALKQMLLPFKLFIGGPLGRGRQWFSWIHSEDAADGYLFAVDTKEITGPVNLSSPNPVRMREFADTLGEILNRPSLFKVPEFALKIAVGEAGEVITYSQKVFPEKLLRCGFNFKYPQLKEALQELLKKG